MIEKMKMVYVVSSVSGKQELLNGLRQLGILHIAERKSPDREASERFTTLSRTASMLQDFAPQKEKNKKNPENSAERYKLLSDDEFQEMYEEVLETIDRRSGLVQEISTCRTEIERLEAWGDFSPFELSTIKEFGMDLHFYRIDKHELAKAQEDPEIRYIRLKPVTGMDAIAVVGRLPESVQAEEFDIPKRGISDLKIEIEGLNAEVEECDIVLKAAALLQDSFNDQMLKAQNAEDFSSASETAENDEDFVWLSGYIPEADIETFKHAAAINKWAWAVEDVSDDDEQIPTKVKYSKISRLIKPVFDILGILPGYRESDISMWFFLFFILFFAMIIGDAGYGALVLIGTIAYVAKTKKTGDAVFLLTVLSVATIVWGAVTGTWFGMESAMNVPILRAMVIPSFANYPQYFGVSTQAQQNAIIKFSFSIGAVQMALGSLLAIRKKLAMKNLSWVADLGWLVAVVAMYLLSLYLVVGENIPVKPVFILIGIAFVLVVMFGGMAPDKTFAEGIKSGLADAFTVFLNTISCFGNVMSYIRLFAVGMAGLAISQSFNSMAAGFKGPLVIFGVLIVLVGHGLNIIMCFLSVVVHGVRLNVLEFSGQVGLEWTGISYEPFKENEKIRK